MKGGQRKDRRGGKPDRQTDRQRHTEGVRQTDRQTARVRQSDRPAQTDRDRQTEKKRKIHFYLEEGLQEDQLDKVRQQ